MNARLPVSFVLATGIAAGLFLLMSLLITGDISPLTSSERRFVVDRIEIKREPPPPERARTRTDELRPARLSSASAPAVAFDPGPAPGETSVPRPALSFAPRLFDAAGTTGALPGTFGGQGVAAASGGGAFDGVPTIPASSARPRYPRYAAERGIEGWVEVIFVIDTNGRVSNVRVLDASPRGIFEDAAVKAMRRWIYQPLVVGGKAVHREATQLFEFRKEDIESLWIYGEN